MDVLNTPAGEQQSPLSNSSQETPALKFRERFESLVPLIQERWPEVAHQSLEATRGSLDAVSQLIAEHTGRATDVVQRQLEELLQAAVGRGRDLVDGLQPLEKQLEELLDELNSTLRPRIERPVRQRPLLSLAIAASVGVLVGAMLTRGRRST
ncbi:hypothetical protein OMCYN_01539 [cyanobiont of Ornithocercus magnificus]|nr:hypothetical protein OMCYN_01539 [cyanobiont of Ornithocercus magnificus]